MINFIRNYFKQRNKKIKKYNNNLYRLSLINRAIQYRIHFFNELENIYK